MHILPEIQGRSLKTIWGTKATGISRTTMVQHCYGVFVHLAETDAGFDNITSFVDLFSKRVHLILPRTSETAPDVARCFFDNIFRFHGLPDSIVSDRDPKFTATCLDELIKLCEIRLSISTSKHPLTDGSSEIITRMVENYLRCYCAHNQRDWYYLLAAAEFAYNSVTVESKKIFLFELDLGWSPRALLDFIGQQSDLMIQSFADLTQRLEVSFSDASFSHLLAQVRQSAYNEKRYLLHYYVV